MARTYSYDPSKVTEPGIDRMRFELGDTMVEGKADTTALTDEEIQAALSLHAKWKRAKLALLESLCRRFAFEVDTKTGPLSFGFNERAKLWREDYEKLKKEVSESSTAVPKYGVHVDGSRNDPSFWTGMMENTETGNDTEHHVHASRKPI